MRQLVTFPSADTAQSLADYLLTLHIDTKLERQPEGWAVWVRDEDQMAQARQELDEFTRNPHDARYLAAATEADALRRQQASAEQAYHRRQRRFDAKMRDADAAGRWTIALIVVSVLVSLLSEGGSSNTGIVKELSIAPYRYVAVLSPADSEDEEERFVPRLQSEGLGPVLHGQVWRLVTPIFIHFGILHLLFNMYMLYDLGGAIERRRGPIRYLSLVLVLAVVSNLVQYFLGHPSWDGSELRWTLVPNFGGMSGVLYGLFGYLWMKAQLSTRTRSAHPSQHGDLSNRLVLPVHDGLGRSHRQRRPRRRSDRRHRPRLRADPVEFLRSLRLSHRAESRQGHRRQERHERHVVA